MQALSRVSTAPRQAVITVALLALLVSAALGYFIRYATSAASTGTAQAVRQTAAAPGDAVGDRWWDDTELSAPAAVGPDGGPTCIWNDDDRKAC